MPPGPPTIVYALGGGAGHLARASIFAARALAGTPTTILHAAGAPHVVGAPRSVTLSPVDAGANGDAVRDRLLDLLADGAHDLVVDTFPGGIFHEIDDAVLARARRTTLIRRYVKREAYDDYDDLARRFRSTVVPYDAEQCEWEDAAIDGASFTGPLVRTVAVAGEDPVDLVVVGDATRLGATMRKRLPTRTVFVRGAFDALPRAKRYLATSGGYHTTYELARLGVPFGVMPEEKRYDDQFRRASLLGRAVLDARDLDRLVAEAA